MVYQFALIFLKQIKKFMMKTENEKLNLILPEIEKRIRELFGEKLVKIILYGSYLRGDNTDESDIDIMVIVNDENLEMYKEKSIALTNYYLDKESILLSIIIEKESFVERYKNHSPFLINLVKEGTVIYG
ncbi:MAG: hypothetical protein C0425_11385 [Chlorobiaceae bacterium]|nr:hypothetical protein [Chlorobiaceae bacterium]